MRKLLQLAMIFFMGLGVLRCGAKGKSADVDFSVTPDSPIVITGDFKVGDKTVKAPWFSFGGTVTNNSDEEVTIVALEMTVTGTTINGGFISKNVTVTPSDFDFSVACNDDTTWQSAFVSFGTYASGQSADLQLPATPTAPADCAGVVSASYEAKIFVGSNPSKDGDQVSSYNFTVYAKPLGWFGSYNKPTARFEKNIVFMTE